MEPNPLDWIEFRTVGRQGHEGDVFGDAKRSFIVPASTVEHHDCVHLLGQRGGEVFKEQVHDRCVDAGQHEGEVLAGGWTHGREDVGPLVTILAEARSTLALEPPAMADPAFVADARLVLEPELELLLGMRASDRFQSVAEPLFLNRS